MSATTPMNPACRYKVAIAAPSAPPARIGGVASAHYNLYSALAGVGCLATLLTYNEPEQRPDEPGIIRAGASARMRSLLGLGVTAYLRLHGSRQIAYQLNDIIGSIPGALRMKRHLRHIDPDILIIPDRGAPGLCLPKAWATVIQVVHHVPMRFVAEPSFGAFCKVDAVKATALEQKALKTVDLVVCPSDYIRKIFREVYRFEGEAVVIPNAVDVALIQSIEVNDVRRHLRLAPEAPVVYIPSAGSPLKGSGFIPEIIRSLASDFAGPIGFYLSGNIDAKLVSELERVPEHARIYMPGQTSHCETIALLKSCSFGVSPTLIENFSMALLEAGCCGVPMVTFDVGGNRELIADGLSGFLVQCQDLRSLLWRSSSLLQRGLCERMQASTMQHVTQHFSTEVIAKQYLILFDSVTRITGES